ncbi:MAG: aminoacetone oxidase family FAD-binding enzyme [Spartobacteria bacterium]|nr:aminoacetone oxidase family FAD-binding enzyme [Spartobacteria bacterium]
MNTDFLIIGAGASGLMAAVAAAEKNCRAVLLERRHQPGRKLLMCGNNRCNITSAIPVSDMLNDFGEPVASFLRPSLQVFGPKELIAWFRKRQLPTVTHKDNRVFPASEKAADVLHCFTDQLRRVQAPVVYNCAVTGIQKLTSGGFRVVADNLCLESRCVLIATGGVSYPKTGSVGDGQKFATALGHKVMPYRPGLVGFEVRETWLNRHADAAFPGAEVRIVCGDREEARTFGEVLVTKWGVSGPSIVNASRIIARRNLRGYHFVVDVCPALTEAALEQRLGERMGGPGRVKIRTLLEVTGMTPSVMNDFVRHVFKCSPEQITRAGLPALAHALKHWELHPTGPRPLKEAMVTVGGVSLDAVNPESMESRHVPGLYFAGEVLDIDGPTGGYNLQAAFATAQRAVHSL